ncbi:MAG TPA: hypothetical protein VLF66_03060 [Thermoanaerobaculia bacterium]|nr:hypothetical protein [Thermoanaerobaculia bacterium]
MSTRTQQAPYRLLVLACALAGVGLVSIPGGAWAGCCKTFPQRHNVVAVESIRSSPSELTINLTLDGMVQGPTDDGVTASQMYGAILIPDTWSGVSVSYAGTCTVSLDGSVLAELDSEDPEHVQQVMEDFGIPFQGSNAVQDGQVVKPEWHPDAAVAAMAELAEPAPAGRHWVGFSSDFFDFSQIPEVLMSSRIDGVFTTSITIANAPKGGAFQAVIRGGDEAEGIDTVRVPVLVDAGVITPHQREPVGVSTFSMRRPGGWSAFALAGLAALFGVVVVARRSVRVRDDD